MRIPVCGLLVVAFAFGGCGGRVVVDGSSGEDGAGGTFGVSSSSRAVAVSVSAAAHVAVAVSVSSSASGSGGGILCGKYPFPGIGAPCNVPNEFCDVPFACCKAQAHCKQGFWSINSLECTPNDCAVDCEIGSQADLDCVAGAVCVVHVSQDVSFQCRQNPCAGPLDCACAEPYCKEQGMTCAGIENGSKVFCK